MAGMADEAAPTDVTTAPAAEPQRLRLDVVALLRDVLVVYRRHWFGLIVAALIVFAPLAVVDALLEKAHPHGFLAVGTIAVGQSLFHLVGDVFYTGLVAAAVIAWRAGGPRLGPLAVARALPWRTVAALDLVLPLATAIGFALLIVPGVIIYIYFALAPAIVKIDHVGMRESLSRSARLVRGNFWRVLVVFVVVTGLEGVLEQVLQSLVDEFIGLGVINLAIQLIGAPFNGLATVLIAYALRPSVASHETAQAGE
jgi:hypothetical protein